MDGALELFPVAPALGLSVPAAFAARGNANAAAMAAAMSDLGFSMAFLPFRWWMNPLKN
jgi:hypothetical protein